MTRWLVVPPGRHCLPLSVQLASLASNPASARQANGWACELSTELTL